MRLLRCLPGIHDYGWPIHGQQTCRRCGKEIKARLQIEVNPRFDVPRYTPRATEKPPARKAWSPC